MSESERDGGMRGEGEKEREGKKEREREGEEERRRRERREAGVGADTLSYRHVGVPDFLHPKANKPLKE